MSVILQPQVAFPIVRQIANHTDATTYYVRAVVRNEAGVTIDTVNLASQGGQRYQTSWRVPVDSTGHGRYISIVTSVYTDSGYTSKSENYGDEETTYLIFDRVMPAMRGGGGGTLDAYTVRRIFREELEKLPEPEKVEFPAQPTYHAELGFILDELEKLHDLSTIPEERPDYSPIFARLEALGRQIDAKPVTPATDLQNVSKAISEAVEAIQQGNMAVLIALEELERKLVESLPQHVGSAFENLELQVRAPKAQKQEAFNLDQFAT